MRLPEQLDTSDLLQRVVLLLTESVRLRLSAAANAELELAEEAGDAAGAEGTQACMAEAGVPIYVSISK